MLRILFTSMFAAALMSSRPIRPFAPLMRILGAMAESAIERGEGLQENFLVG